MMSIPKSGTHLMIEVLQQAFGSYFLYMPGWGGSVVVDFDWMKKCLKEEIYTSAKKTRYLAPSHSSEGFGFWSEQIQNDARLRGLFMVRDPRDIIVSMVRSTVEGIWPESPYVGRLRDKSKEDQYLAMLNEPVIYTRQANSYTPFYDSDLFLTVRYEDLLGMDRGGNTRTQGKAIDAIAGQLNTCSLNIAHGVLSAANRTTWTKRKSGARCGEWKEIFTDKIKDRCKKTFGDVIIKWGYEKNNNW